MNPYRVEFGPAAAKAFEKLAPDVRARLARALGKLAQDAAQIGRIEGKAVKTVHGAGDTFHRLRVGDYRVMYDVLEDDQVLLVLGIVHRSDLQRWIRNR